MSEVMLENESATLKLGAAINQALGEKHSSQIEIHLNGNLGAGKTTLVRGVLVDAGWSESVTSPSYTLCEEYEINKSLFLHVDLYRINASEDIEILNLDRRTAKQKIIFIEWSENLKKERPCNLIIDLIHDARKRRAFIRTKDIELKSRILTYYEKN